ncbi:proteasome subunit beta type-1-like [Photinus pyralis]|uniref:proteasome subunit beta type-1-like n=1 Tax=Photinus pyralis TaxID=7054 RepID=UPI0012672D65|nr:proteasome subunit beta type-1-like [Photinus pyralis]
MEFLFTNERTIHDRFHPYEYNGGTVTAIAGADYAVIAADTRLSSGSFPFAIYTREQKKLFQLTEKTIIGFSGCWCDVVTFRRIMQAQMQSYRLQHNKTMSVTAIAQLASTLMYYKRFFPFWMSTVLAGLDDDGAGCVFGYDPLGFYERRSYACAGSGGKYIYSFFDSWIARKDVTCAHAEVMGLEDAIEITKDAYISASERDIFTGDSVQIRIVDENGVDYDEINLRKD